MKITKFNGTPINDCDYYYDLNNKWFKTKSEKLIINLKDINDVKVTATHNCKIKVGNNSIIKFNNNCHVITGDNCKIIISGHTITKYAGRFRLGKNCVILKRNVEIKHYVPNCIFYIDSYTQMIYDNPISAIKHKKVFKNDINLNRII